MKPEIKKFIDELIKFNKTRKPEVYLKKVFEKHGQREVYSLTDWILLWHKLVFLEQELPEKYDLSKHEVLQKRFAEFFKEVPALNKVFSFNGDHIGWADGINEEEQKEIRNYIHENHKVQVRIRRYKK